MTRRHRVKTTGVICALLALSLTVAGCASGSDSSAGDSTSKSFKVGAILPLTGPASTIGTEFKTMLQQVLKLDPVAKQVNIQWEFCDSQTSPTGAAACATKLIRQEQVDMIYGPLLGVEIGGVEPIVKQAGMPTIVSSAAYKVSDGSPIYQATITLEAMQKTVLKYLQDRSYTKVAVLATSDETGKTLLDDLAQANSSAGNPVTIASESMSPTDVDVTTQLNKLLQGKPDLIAIFGSGAVAGVALKGLKQLGADIPTLQTNTNTSNDFLKAVADVLPTDSIYPMPKSFVVDPNTPGNAEVQQIIDEYQKATGAPLTGLDAVGWDGPRLVADVLKNTNGDKKKALDYLSNLNGFKGLFFANISFTADRHIGDDPSSWVVSRYRDGKFVVPAS